MSQNWNNDPYNNQDYYNQRPEYDNQGYQQAPAAGYADQGYEDWDPDQGQDGLPLNTVTIALIVAVFVCSCASCIVGIGTGIAIWEYTAPTPAASVAPTSPDAAIAVVPVPSSFQRWTTGDVVYAFQAAGLECADPQPLPSDEAVAPFYSVEATRFFIPSLCSTCGGRIYSFDNPADLQQAQAYYINLGQTDPTFYSWVFVKDNILVQINGDLPEDWARAYEAVLMSMG